MRPWRPTARPLQRFGSAPGHPGGGWSADTIGPNILQSHNSIMLYADTFSDQIMLAVQDDGSDLHYALWDGTAGARRPRLRPIPTRSRTSRSCSCGIAVALCPGPGLSLWLAGESSPLVEQFGGDGFTLENPATAGSFSAAFDLSVAEPGASTNINALHYVGSTISLSGVGITSMTLNAGDIIFSVRRIRHARWRIRHKRGPDRLPTDCRG